MKRKVTKGITIDGQNSRDLDDGFWLTETEDSYLLSVSIADVASVVNLSQNVDLYKNALDQVETRYFSTSNDPMLPRYLSEDQLSLLPGVLRPAITFLMTINKTDLEVIDLKIERSQFKSLKKLNFMGVDNAVKEGINTTAINRMLLLSDVLAQQLLAKRRSKGALAIYDINRGWYMNEEGRMVKLTQEEAYRSYVIIQEFMILTNTSVTEHLLKNDVRLVLRNHTARTSVIPRETLMEQLAYITIHPSEIQVGMMQKKLNLTMNRAEYGTTLLGHYGLNLAAYAHWTSPIRRVADLINHIILHAWLDKEYTYSPLKLAKICAHINEVKNKYRDEKNEFFKLQNIPAQGGLNTSGSLSGKNLIKAINQVTKSEEIASDELIAGLSAKVARGALNPREFFLIFFNPKFALKNLRKEAFESISQSKHLAISVVMIAEQAGVVSSVSFQNTEEDNRKFICIGSLEYEGKKFEYKTTHPTAKKEARQLASLSLLSQIINEDTLRLPISKHQLPVVKNNDYISALYEYNNVAVISLDFTWQTKKEEPFLFQGMAGAIIDSKAIEAKSDWLPSKKMAKKQSAQRLYEQINKNK